MPITTKSTESALQAKLRKMGLVKVLGFPSKIVDPEAIEHLITLAPMNSSGDIYHITAYLIVAKAAQYKLPQVYLFYDAKASREQASRSMGFAQMLGYDKQFHMAELPRSSKFFNNNARNADVARWVDNYCQEKQH